ncbi:MAG: cytochrome c3 family protein [Myxococcales bacterium]|nr:cytochrome c3 family protein [Myxococcales bacterium]
MRSVGIGMFLALAILGMGAWQQASAIKAKSLGKRSPIIYPRQQIALRMNHAHPAHRKLRCVVCHTDAGKSRRVEDVLIPKESTCQPCHASDTRAASAPAARKEIGKRCEFCHIGYGTNPKAPAWVPQSRFPHARLRFSHARHIQQGMRCLSCHEGINDAKQGTRAHLPSMRQCLGCHGNPNADKKRDKKGRPSGTCSTCHLSKPDGKLRTRYPEGWLNPPAWLYGMHHDADFIVRHRWIAADHGPLCESCHTQKDCLDCHDGRIRPVSIHPNDFLSTHAQLARREGQRCTTCHSTQSFCAGCHARIGVSMLSAPEVRAKGRFHPDTAQWVGGPSLHAREARRSLSTCISCHAERDCVSCHGGLGIGAGLSPHGPGFLSKCREQKRANDRACRTCHVDTTALCP